MKKIVLSGFMASMLMLPVAALADGETTGSSTPLTTKNYVDDGLRAVYKASKTYTDSKIGDSTTGMTKDVNDLKAIVNGSGTNPGLDKIINGDGTNLGLNDIIKGDGTTANPGLINDVAALDTQINGTNGLDIRSNSLLYGNRSCGIWWSWRKVPKGTSFSSSSRVAQGATGAHPSASSVFMCYTRRKSKDG